ncbi:MAG: glycoside hydrolase family 3 protein [Sedimentisphaeraceae bacterium JB056]
MDNSFINQKIDDMTLEQKIGLLMTVVIEGTTYTPAFEGYITDYHCGGIRVVPSDKYQQKLIISKKYRDAGSEHLERLYITNKDGEAPSVTLPQYAETIKTYLTKTIENSGVPLRVQFDQEGGFSRDLTFGGAHVFPKPMGIVAGGDPKMAYEAANALGRMAKACGLNMIHSPILDVNVNPENPEIYTRAFSDSAEVVAEYALQQARGFKDAGIIATGKHFPGRGDSTMDAHHNIPLIDIDYDTLWNRELLPYRTLIENDVLPAIMTAHTIYPAVDDQEVATLSEKMLKGMLRDKMNFKGVITTDAIGMGGIILKYDIVTACLKTLQAGADMFLLRMVNTADPIGTVIPKVINRIKRALEDNELTEKELDEKVYRILESYDNAGLFKNDGMPEESVEDVLNDKHIIEVCKNINHKSICILRDEDSLLPLAENTRALVIEQRYPRTYCPHDRSWYSGILYDKLSRYSNELSYIETNSIATAEEEETVFEHCDKFDLIIMSNWFYRSNIKSNSALVEKLIARGRKVLILANTPYENQCIPSAARNVIVQLGVTPLSIEAAADIIFGKKEAKGKWPIQYKPA